MLGEKFSHLGLDRLRQQRAPPIAQNLGERVGKRPWLKQLDHGSIGHGVSLLCWRSGGSNTPTIRRLLPVRPSPTSANSSRREGIVQNLYYRWSKEFLEAGKKRLAGDTARSATTQEVTDLRREASALKEVVAELVLENRLLKKSTIGAGEDAA